MNTLFEKLLSGSQLCEKDIHDIRQIFCILPPEKQQRLISNFETLRYNIERINADIAIEQNILFENIITDFDELLKGSKSKNIQNQAQKSIDSLKGEIN